MNISKPLNALSQRIYSLYLWSRRLLPRQRCETFNDGTCHEKPGIQKIYVINLDRQPTRWRDLQCELKRFADKANRPLSERTIRHVACDARDLAGDQSPNNDIDSEYSLAEQLFVEPQPDALPDAFDLEKPIKMSPAEIAVARSHIAVWRRFVESDATYALILEDDVLFEHGFSGILDRAWRELNEAGKSPEFDVLYLSYKEVRYGAPKQLVSETLFRPERGLWYMSGYVLSKKGAKRLLQLLPCRGPVDLWINHKFDQLEVRAVRRSIIAQRRDLNSTNSYSILPMLSRIGIIDGGEALFHQNLEHTPIFCFGPPGSGLTSLGMALSMLGYRCCSDLDRLPPVEMERLLNVYENRVFNAYVNISSLTSKLHVLKELYPDAKFVVLDKRENLTPILRDAIGGADVVFLHDGAGDPWRVICEHLRIAPPQAPYPKLRDIGTRTYRQPDSPFSNTLTASQLKHDLSPWSVEPVDEWVGITVRPKTRPTDPRHRRVCFDDSFAAIQTDRWSIRSDTFPGNLALFRPDNVAITPNGGLKLVVREDKLGVRNFSAGALSSSATYLYGRFEAEFQATNTPGLVTGFFLHRDSPRQEIDIEIAGNKPDQLLVNVFYNPGPEGAKFDYGYRGTPIAIELGFDASKAPHHYAIEWDADEIRWYVDDKLVHRRVLWNPTPIPDLPMTLHVNTWPTRSHELAGRLKSRSLPVASLITQISVDAFEVSQAIDASPISPPQLEVC